MMMRRLMLIGLAGCVSVLAGCSYLTDFVVVNQSDQTVEVRYKIKNYPGPLVPPVAPATIATSRLNTKRGQEWNELAPDTYRLDQENRTVTVELMPHQALRIARMHNYSGHEDRIDAEDFPVEEVIVTGTHEVKLTGEQARINFSEGSRILYTLTYK